MPVGGVGRLVRLGLAEGDDVRRQPLDLLRHEPALGHGVGRELLVDEDLEHQLAGGPPVIYLPAETYAVDAGQAQEPLRGPLLAGAELVVGQVARHVIVGHLPTPTGPSPQARPHSSHTAPEGLPCQPLPRHYRVNACHIPVLFVAGGVLASPSRSLTST